MTNDRNYLRMLDDNSLINMGRERYNGDDLVLVLAERLSELLDVQEELDEAKNEIVELRESRDIWKAEALENLARPNLTPKEGAQAFVDWQASLPPKAK